MYIIVDYLRRPLAPVRKLGLSLALALAKRVDHRRTLANLSDLRDAVQSCTEDEDEEIQTLANDLLKKIKGGRVSGRSLRSRPSNTSSSTSM